MIPRNATLFRQDPDGGDNIPLTEEETAEFWRDFDAVLAAPRKDYVPASISDRQFFQQLAIDSVITEQEAEDAVATGAVPAAMLALIDQLQEDQRFSARMMLKGATVFERDHPLTTALGAMYGWTERQIDELFQGAAAL